MARDKGPRDDRWYFSLMAPNTKGDKFAWLDPTSIYINGEAYHDLLDDLAADLDPEEIDVVAGLDAMGFVLAAGIAARIGRGFLPIRKPGKLCVETDSASMTNYSGQTQSMEMPLRPERGFCWWISGWKPAARCMVPCNWSNSRRA